MTLRARPLSECSAEDLRPLLEEEAGFWAGELHWDYAEVSQAVASGLERRSLSGRVLEDGGGAAAYCYYMVDGGRAIVGSLFAGARSRGRGYEEALLDGLLEQAKSEASAERVECQTLFSTAPGADERFARAGFASRPRHYLMRDLREPIEVPRHDFRLRPLRREDLTAAAELIHRSHAGTLDAALNLTYSTPGHCRSFVDTLVLRGGCGRFDGEASLIACGERGPLGALLASQLSGSNGHICQVSVLPEAQGLGLGRVLLACALRSLRGQELETASLSVTVENRRAYGLYERFGFRVRKAFAAHAWVKPPAQLRLPISPLPFGERVRLRG